MTAHTILLERVSKSFGRQYAVQEVDLALAAGESVGLVGQNGAGKTTLIKLMLGLLRPSGGHVSVLGGDPAHASGARARRKMGYLPENVALYPALTGLETIYFFARLKGEPLDRARALLDRVGLSAEAAARRVGTYSKGMRQRLALVQALLGNPRALLLDEPTNGLDPELRQSFYGLLRDLRGAGTTVLISSHALAELEGEVDRVVVISQGRKMADGNLSLLRQLAGTLPRLRVRLASSGSRIALPGWQPLPGDQFECSCVEEQIVERLRALPDSIVSVEILRPSLDDIYAAFLRRSGAAA
jgi:Cu-processing system ATP-binding protein